jgi:hypothetical protein
MIMQKEYWINVYDFSGLEPNSPNPYSLGYKWSSRAEAVKEHYEWRNPVMVGFKHMPIYRIHVKMKPVVPKLERLNWPVIKMEW